MDAVSFSATIVVLFCWYFVAATIVVLSRLLAYKHAILLLLL